MFESIKIYRQEAIDIEKTIAGLVEYGYARTKRITEVGDFSLLGGNLFVFPVTFEYPICVELEEDRVRKIRSIDIISYETITEHNACIILPIKGVLRKARIKHKALRLGEERPIDNFVDLEAGDHVVHIDYGIGKFLGVERIKSEKSAYRDHIVIEYRDADKLYVPFEDLDKIQKYISFEGRSPRLNKLGGRRWKTAKERARKGVEKIAVELLEVQAKRESLKGHSFSPDTDWQKKVEESFPYKETPDQAKAAIDVKRDMEKPRPMDRLLCGDVGYGKTEVALRAAFKTVMDNKQVAVLVPTTILAEQHYTTFTQRFKDFPVNIEMLSRFKSPAEQGLIIEGLKKQYADVVIGTHRLLSEDIDFKDLGLVIIDEEQRFGVRHKEKLKKLRLVVDVLTLTATPIPRTLYLALMGGRDISVINTPPLERLPVKTHIIERDDSIIRKAIENELKRNGQVYFVHNRIDGIEKIRESVTRLVPDARIVTAHGRMKEHVLEKTILEFMKGKIDVLVCTTIIESGIDVPNANTMIINRADMFGLADMYQLRGRVGRFDRQAYAYLVVDNLHALTHDVQRRLESIKKYQELGSGFKIAMQDLEIRGAGNLLGVEQHGYIMSVGFDLYCRLLKAAIEGEKSEGA